MGICILANLLRHENYETRKDGIETLRKIPLRIGEWQGKDLQLEKLIYEILETKSIVQRSYLWNNQVVFLTIVYYPEQKVDFHAPEACLGGRGIQIQKQINKVRIVSDGKEHNIKLNQLIWDQQGEQRLVYYFYKSGEFLGESYMKLRLNLAVNAIRNRQKSGSLIQVSTPITHGNLQKASHTLRDFMSKVYPFLIEVL